jgi:glycogen debranching enzyme
MWGAATAGLRFLLERRARTASGLVRVVHPWETGCDDSPRWDDLSPGDGFDLEAWRSHKNGLLGSVVRGPAGEPVDNPAFPVGSIGFNALVAWNARELATVRDDDELRSAADELSSAIESRWSPEEGTWVDEGPTEAGSGRIRTADALLAMLVASDGASRRVVASSLLDHDAHGAPFGPRGVHRDEPSYDPDSYWRGPVWPQMAYLLWVATGRSSSAGSTPTSTPTSSDGERAASEAIRRGTLDGAATSRLAEYWNPDTGAGGGAVPQSWTGLALVMVAG